MNRRGFMQAILAAAAAPYIISKAGVLMPIAKVFTSPSSFIELIGDGITDDTRALQAFLDGEMVFYKGEFLERYLLPNTTIAFHGTINITDQTVRSIDDCTLIGRATEQQPMVRITRSAFNSKPSAINNCSLLSISTKYKISA